MSAYPTPRGLMPGAIRGGAPRGADCHGHLGML
jgi:hypothetical protein